MNRTTISMFLALTFIGGIARAAEFRAKPADAALRDAERAYPRIDVKANWFPTHLVGDRGYRVNANTVTDATGPDKSKYRRASVPVGYRLRWIGTAAGIAYLIADRDVAKFDPNDPESNRRIHRLDLGSMKWLDPFKLPEPSIDRSRGDVVHFGGDATKKPKRHVLPNHLLVTPKGIVLLCEETIEQQDAFAPDITQYESVGYHVSCYAPKDTKSKWDRAIRYGNPSRRVVGYSMRFYDDSIQQLTYVSGAVDDDLILVCAGERNAVVCLAAADGKVQWRIPAIWEYERGFIGPSAFEHYIERFGLDYWTVEAAKTPVLREGEKDIDPKELRERIQRKMKSRRKFTAARKAFYARYQGRITAGPIIAHGADRYGTPRIYVAATRSLKPDPGAVEQPEHAFIYEIEPNGDSAEITGMTRLPRAVIGSPYRKVRGGIVLSCDHGCMVRLRTYEPVFGGIIGPGRAADDLVLHIDWYREYLMRSPSAWLIADPPTDVAGFSKARFFRPSRAYVRTRDDKIYELHINVVDLRTGLDRDLTLSVPFEGTLPISDEGLSSVNRGDENEKLHSHGPHAIWIDDLRVDDNRLTAVVAHNSDYTALTFDLSAMLDNE